MAMTRWGVFCVLFFLISGCSSGYRQSAPVSQGDLIGKYVVKWEPYPGRNFGKETLTLKSDGTFSQIFVTTFGNVHKNSGSWVLEQDSTGPIVHLIDTKKYVSPSYNAFTASPKPEDWFLHVHKHGRDISITIDEDSDLYYKKIP